MTAPIDFVEMLYRSGFQRATPFVSEHAKRPTGSWAGEWL